MSVKVFVINAGSSSVKSCVYELERNQQNRTTLNPIWQAQANLQGSSGELKIKPFKGEPQSISFANESVDSAYVQLYTALNTHPGSPIDSPDEIHAVGHRIVHGGEKYFEPTLLTEEVMRNLEGLIDLAPSHLPSNLKGIRTAKDHFPQSKQIGVFDTGFHSTMPDEAIIYPVPWEWYQDKLIRRYGFHGISHSYCMRRVAQLLEKEADELRIINCHLGSGGSLCAIKHGESVMNTMGFTPLEGLVMGTRCGSIDPGIILHLLNKPGYTAQDLERELNKESGLKGISGISGDMREIAKAAEEKNPRASLAIEIYVRSVSSGIAAMLPLLGGLDVLSFAGGIGENSASIRLAVVERLKFLGIEVDSERNNANAEDRKISTAKSSVETLVIHTNEELEIASECLQFFGNEN
ncbi:MAG TPA: acetate kinase [Oculatellaceae cyanobacterium]